MAKIADKYFLCDPWQIIEEGFDPSYARVSESIFALSNETLGIRGSFDEGGSMDSLRGAYVNGIYEIAALPKSYKGIIEKSHFMVPAADWSYFSLSLDGEELDLGKVKFSAFRRELDMRAGTLTRSFVWHTATGKDLRLTFLRFMDMQQRERAYIRVSLEALNFSGAVELKSGISFDVWHEGRDTCFWGDTRMEIGTDCLAIQSRTLTSGQELHAGAVITVNGAVDAPKWAACETGKTAALTTRLIITQGQTLNVEKKIIMLFDGTEGENLWQNGRAALCAAAELSLDGALAAQRVYWDKYWQETDMEIEAAAGADAAAVAAEQQGIRFCCFNMAQAYGGGSVRHNIGAKGLTGEGYNGHAFWDTEAFHLPFYLFTQPEAARSLLMYRYNTLPQALERAKMLDCTGACYPIATLNGDEGCDLWQHASLQFHPSTAVAYGIWHYALVTGDQDFVWAHGAEILLQIARFLESRAGQNPHTGEYGYYGVMGPDEFQMMVHNNAYTNYMAKRTLEYAAGTLRAMQGEKPAQYQALAARTHLAADEIGRWEDMAAHMAMPMGEGGLIEQHDGYFNMPHIDIHAIPITEFPLYHHWSYDRIYRNDMIKQPDVLMFLFLYSSSFSLAQKRVNYEYYEPRTIHESSLSPAIHSILAAELNKMDEATEFFGFATRLDLDNYNRNTNEGLHTASIAMAWVNIVYGFAGLRSDAEPLCFAPRLPERWSRLKFSLRWRGRVMDVELKKDVTEFRLREGEAFGLVVYGKEYWLDAAGLEVNEEKT